MCVCVCKGVDDEIGVMLCMDPHRSRPFHIARPVAHSRLCVLSVPFLELVLHMVNIDDTNNNILRLVPLPMSLCLVFASAPRLSFTCKHFPFLVPLGGLLRAPFTVQCEGYFTLLLFSHLGQGYFTRLSH